MLEVTYIVCSTLYTHRLRCACVSGAVTAPPVARWCRSASTWTGPPCWWAASAPSLCALTGGAAASRGPTCCTASRRSWVCLRSGTSWRRSGPPLFAYWQWCSGDCLSGETVYDVIKYESCVHACMRTRKLARAHTSVHTFRRSLRFVTCQIWELKLIWIIKINMFNNNASFLLPDILQQ